MTLDYLAALRDNSARFTEVLRDAPADAPVPSCPGWLTDDLIWHLGEVQWFWGTVVSEDVADPEQVRHPARPDDRQGLLAFFDGASALLQSSLARTDPAAPRWTWSQDRTAGFIRRRQAHEALIHRIDAELTADVERAPVDPVLAGDGVDEALRVMYGGAPAWAEARPDPAATLRVCSTDTDRSWLVTLAFLSGTDPRGRSYTDEPSVEVAATDDPTARAAATVEGTAADLDCWLWGRPTSGAVYRTGDDDVLTRFQAMVSEGIQ